MLGNGPHMFDNGPNVLGKSTFGLMSHSKLLYSMYEAFGILSHSVLSCTGILSHSEFCHTQNLVAFGIMSHSGLCRSALCSSGLCRIRGYVVWHNVAFGIMSHSDFCCPG